MTDKIGVLGEATTATAATTTVYTVPAGKAARGKIFWQIQGAADGTTDIAILVNGITVANQANIAASGYLWSTSTQITQAAAASASAALPLGTTAAETNAPAPFEYFLTAADVVQYTIGGTTALGMNMQFVGTEIDV